MQCFIDGQWSNVSLSFSWEVLFFLESTEHSVYHNKNSLQRKVTEALSGLVWPQAGFKNDLHCSFGKKKLVFKEVLHLSMSANLSLPLTKAMPVFVL